MMVLLVGLILLRQRMTHGHSLPFNFEVIDMCCYNTVSMALAPV